MPITPLNRCLHCPPCLDYAAWSSPNRPAMPRKKRANHNELERRRRNLQKDVMGELRDVIPILGTDKPSTVVTLTKGAACSGTCSRLGRQRFMLFTMVSLAEVTFSAGVHFAAGEARGGAGGRAGPPAEGA